MDNLPSHKGDAVRTRTDAAGAALPYRPAYSPELNPIEMPFSKIEQRFRALALRTGATDAPLPWPVALSMEWSDGQVEGQVNRLKLIKRQMYGRANDDLLRQRVLRSV